VYNAQNSYNIINFALRVYEIYVKSDAFTLSHGTNVAKHQTHKFGMIKEI